MSGRIAAGITRWSPARRTLIAATEKRLRGGWASFLCRKRYIDDQLVNAVAKGLDAVMILGAGYDTARIGYPSWSVSPSAKWICRPISPARPRRCGAASAGLPPGVTLLPGDFETDNLAERLDHEGFNAGARTVYVWEAVTQYLTEPAVRQTMDYLGGAATGSGLVFTFVRKDFLDGQAMYGAEPAYQDFVAKPGLWRFGLHPEQVAGFLAE